MSKLNHSMALYSHHNCMKPLIQYSFVCTNSSVRVIRVKANNQFVILFLTIIKMFSLLQNNQSCQLFHFVFIQTKLCYQITVPRMWCLHGLNNQVDDRGRPILNQVSGSKYQASLSQMGETKKKKTNNRP